MDEGCPLAPASHYGMSKVLGEQSLLFYGGLFGLPVVSLRLANVYGPRQHPRPRGGRRHDFREKPDGGRGGHPLWARARAFQEKTGWRPKYGLEEGIAAFVKSLQAYPGRRP